MGVIVEKYQVPSCPLTGRLKWWWWGGLGVDCLGQVLALALLPSLPTPTDFMVPARIEAASEALLQKGKTCFLASACL